MQTNLIEYAPKAFKRSLRKKPLPPKKLEELGEAMLWACKLAVAKRWYGPPPAGMSWDDLRQEVLVRVLPRAQRWKPGKQPLEKYCYVLCSFTLRDIAKKAKLEARNGVRFDSEAVDNSNAADETPENSFDAE